LHHAECLQSHNPPAPIDVAEETPSASCSLFRPSSRLRSRDSDSPGRLSRAPLRSPRRRSNTAS